MDKREEELYDEFGNYIGPELDQDPFPTDQPDSDLEASLRNSQQQPDQDLQSSEDGAEYIRRGQQIVLHEDKEYYPAAQTVFGAGVEALVEEEDHQPITKPIIDPPKSKFHQVFTKIAPELKYSSEYLVQVMSKPQLLRNVAIIGALHHGKTLLSDLLIESTRKTLPKITNTWEPQKYTDCRIDEISREISVKASPF